MKSVTITGGQVLTRDHGFAGTAMSFDDGCIRLDHARADTLTLDAQEWMVLPGIVDIHGDAFERQLQPRPGVNFPPHLALQDTQAQLLVNGITTAFHGVTLSWEPGLRGVAAWRALLDARGSQNWVCDMRVHLRWEAFNLDALDMAIDDIGRGRVHLLAFNDHTPCILAKLDDAAAVAKYSDRAGISADAFRTIAHRIAARSDQVAEAQLRIAGAARAARLPMASHDDATIAERTHFRQLGAGICEFPMNEAVGKAAQVANDAVVMGSPNVVRGGSHLGWASAARLAEAGICNVLSSDYFYPAMAQAGFILADRSTLDFASAWALISRNPAAAVGLPDRGAIADGLRGDVIVVDPQTRSVEATLVQGRLAHLTARAAARLS